MKSALLILFIALFLSAGEQLPSNIWAFQETYRIGMPREKAIAQAQSESDVFLYGDIIYFQRYMFFDAPLGVSLHRYRVIFDADTVAYMEHFHGHWVDILKEQAPEKKERATARDFKQWEESMSLFRTKLHSSTDSMKVYHLQGRDHKIISKIYTDHGFTALHRIYKDDVFATVATPSRKKQWFGIGNETQDSIIKIKETTSIPLSEEIKFIWEVETDFDTATETFLTIRFPAPLPESSIPSGVVYDREKQTVTMPMGKYREIFTAVFGLHKNDPIGLYSMMLTTETDTIASVSHTVTKEE